MRFLGIALVGVGLGLAALMAANAPVHGADETVDGTVRFEDTPYPRIAMLWRPGRGDDYALERHARYDLILTGPWLFHLEYDAEPHGLAAGFTPESIETAQERVETLRELNPEAVILGDIYFFEYREDWLPEDHPWWLRVDGEREQFWPGTYRLDWTNPEVQEHTISRTLSLKEAGVDGVFYDNLRDEPDAWVPFLEKLREAVGDDFLILANSGYAVGEHDFAAPFINGFIYESGWSHGRTEWDEIVEAKQHTESLLQEPRISVIERFEVTEGRAGWPGDPGRGEPPEDRDHQARRWSMAYALAIGDYFYLFADDTSHAHDWYEEYDREIGLPAAPGERVSSHVWRRRYDKALVVVNLPGAEAPHEVTLDQPAEDAFTGETGTTFTIPPGDGRILIME